MDPNKSLKEKVLDKIRASEIQMHSRTYFILRLVSVTALIVAILAVSIFIFNFIAFSIRLNHHDVLLGFGPSGYLLFLQFFPWGLVLIDVGLVAVLQILIRRFEFGYRIPVLRLIAAILVVALVAGFALDATKVNEHFLHDADDEHLPAPFGPMYAGARRSPPPQGPVHKAVVTAITVNTLIVKDLTMASSVYTIVLPTNDSRATTSMLQVGDTIFFAGHFENGVFHAFGLRSVSSD